MPTLRNLALSVELVSIVGITGTPGSRRAATSRIACIRAVLALDPVGVEPSRVSISNWGSLSTRRNVAMKPAGVSPGRRRASIWAQATPGIDVDFIATLETRD